MTRSITQHLASPSMFVVFGHCNMWGAFEQSCLLLGLVDRDTSMGTHFMPLKPHCFAWQWGVLVQINLCSHFLGHRFLLRPQNPLQFPEVLSLQLRLSNIVHL